MTYKQAAKLAGMVLLAVLGAQILNIILFYLLSYGISAKLPDELVMVVFLFPGILAALGGGYFLGRLLPDYGWKFWIISGGCNAVLPVGFQVVLNTGGAWDGSTTLQMLAVSLGSLIIWTAGGRLGRWDLERRPSAQFDRMLLQITAGGVGIVILLYGVSWGSIHFEEGYREAGRIAIPLPPNVTEESGGFADYRVAAGKRFSLDAPAMDREVFEFYDKVFRDRYVDVTRTFQEHGPGEWFHVKKEVRDRVYDYYAAGAHWRDTAKNVLISLLMRAEKTVPDQSWESGTWHITGVVVTQAYHEPQPTPAPSPGRFPASGFTPRKHDKPSSIGEGGRGDTPIPSPPMGGPVGDASPVETAAAGENA